jgi:hypothetical protein
VNTSEITSDGGRIIRVIEHEDMLWFAIERIMLTPDTDTAKVTRIALSKDELKKICSVILKK